MKIHVNSQRAGFKRALKHIELNEDELVGVRSDARTTEDEPNAEDMLWQNGLHLDVTHYWFEKCSGVDCSVFRMFHSSSATCRTLILQHSPTNRTLNDWAVHAGRTEHSST